MSILSSTKTGLKYYIQNEMIPRIDWFFYNHMYYNQSLFYFSYPFQYETTKHNVKVIVVHPRNYNKETFEKYILTELEKFSNEHNFSLRDIKICHCKA